jgi:hypothetical protein
MGRRYFVPRKFSAFMVKGSFSARNLPFIHIVDSTTNFARLVNVVQRGEAGTGTILAPSGANNPFVRSKEMRKKLWTGRLLTAVLAGVALVAVGCQEATTEKDVADARQDVREEQRETADTVRDAQKDVADARQDAQPYTVNRPVTGEDAAEARQDVADARHEAQKDIADQKQDEREAALELKTVEQKAAATKARDSFVAQTEQQLADAENRIDQLKTSASATDGANKETLDRQIDTLQGHHDRVEDALGNLKTAKLEEWQTHRQHVRMAMQDLNNSMANVR